MFWVPRRRPTYRIVEVKDWCYTCAVQQRVRWLWMEWWRTVEQCITIECARRLVRRFEAYDLKHPREMVIE